MPTLAQLGLLSPRLNNPPPPTPQLPVTITIGGGAQPQTGGGGSLLQGLGLQPGASGPGGTLLGGQPNPNAGLALTQLLGQQQPGNLRNPGRPNMPNMPGIPDAQIGGWKTGEKKEVNNSYLNPLIRAMREVFGSQGVMSRITLEEILMNIFGENTGRKMIKDLGANPGSRPFASSSDIQETYQKNSMDWPVLPLINAAGALTPGNPYAEEDSDVLEWYDAILPEGGKHQALDEATADYIKKMLEDARIAALGEESLKQPLDETPPVDEYIPETYGGWWGSSWGGGGGGGSQKKWIDWFRNMYWNVT